MKPSATKLIVRVSIAVACLGLLGVTVFVVWRTQLTRDVERQLAAIRAAGLPTNGKELNSYYASVPDSQNAALVMTQAFALLKTFPDSRSNAFKSFKMPGRTERLTAEQTQLLSDYVDLNEPALAKAREASRLPRSRYPVDYSPGFAALLPHLAKFKQLAQAARYKSVVALERADFAVAFDSSADILSMAKTLDADPCVISQLMRMAVTQTGVSSMERCLIATTVSGDHLQRLGKTFLEAESNEAMAIAFIGERAMYLPVFRMSPAEMERFAKSMEEIGDDSPALPMLGKQPVFLKISGFFERDLRFYLKVMETNIALAKLPPPQCLQSAKEFETAEEVSRENLFIFSRMFLPALSRVVPKEVRATASLRMAATAIAVERFRVGQGRLPEKLDELMPKYLDTIPADPFDGAALRYRKLPKGFVIYSVGDDGKDDGGRERPVQVKSTDKSTYDLTFTVER